MRLSERILYHQIHPIKVAVDVVAGLLSLILLWKHNAMPGTVVGTLPPVLCSAALVAGADLRPYRDSHAGQYLERYMTGWTQSLRFVGFGIMWIAALRHSRSGLAGGLVLILVGWFHGLARGVQRAG